MRGGDPDVSDASGRVGRVRVRLGRLGRGGRARVAAALDSSVRGCRSTRRGDRRAGRSTDTGISGHLVQGLEWTCSAIGGCGRPGNVAQASVVNVDIFKRHRRCRRYAGGRLGRLGRVVRVRFRGTRNRSGHVAAACASSTAGCCGRGRLDSSVSGCHGSTRRGDRRVGIHIASSCHLVQGLE
jgi:hypothetical protein